MVHLKQRSLTSSRYLFYSDGYKSTHSGDDSIRFLIPEGCWSVQSRQQDPVEGDHSIVSCYNLNMLLDSLRGVQLDPSQKPTMFSTLILQSARETVLPGPAR